MNIKSLLKKRKYMFTLVVISIVIRSGSALGNAGYAKYVFDSFTGNSMNVSKIVVYGLLIVLWGALGLAFQNWSIDSLINKLTCDMQNIYFNSLLRTNVSTLHELGEGKILTNYTQDINALVSLIRTSIKLVVVPFEMIMASIYLLYTNWLLAIIVLIILPIVIIIGKSVGKLAGKVNRQFLDTNDKTLKLLTRAINGINTIKAYYIEKLIGDEFKKHVIHQMNLSQKQTKYNALFSGITDLFMGLPFIIIYITSASLFSLNRLSVGTITLFLQLLNKITVPFVAYSYILIDFKKAKESINRLSGILDTKKIENIKDINEVRNIYEIKFDMVSFQYNQKMVLQNFNIDLSHGIYYGITGENGTGKSTFFKLLVKLYSPVNGVILFDHMDILKYQGRYNLIYVEDKPRIFYDDIESNILLGTPKDEEKLMQILEDIDMLELDEEQNVTELSSGQLQRINLARALYHATNNSVLLLDETFGTMDPLIVEKLCNTLIKYKKRMNLTIFEITHNVSDMKRFDKILNFKSDEIDFV